MADEVKAAKTPRKRRAPTRASEKPFSLYPLTLEEIADKLLATPPSPRPKKPAATKP
jgi:hypothetical protein